MDRLVLIMTVLLAGACGAKPKGPAPDVAIKTLLQADRSSIASLKDLQGQAVVLEFWATWCVPCRQAIPSMNKMVESFRGRPVTFISVTDEPRETVEPFLKEHPMKAWIGLDEDQSIHRAYGVKSIPQLFVIDRYGRVWHKLDTTFFYKSDVEDALNAPPPTN